MTYVIAEPCIDVLDHSCVEECPADCVYEGARALYIHPDELRRLRRLDRRSDDVQPRPAAVLDQGVDAYFSLCPGPIPLEEAIDRAADLLQRAAEQVLRAYLAGRGGDR